MLVSRPFHMQRSLRMPAPKRSALCFHNQIPHCLLPWLRSFLADLPLEKNTVYKILPQRLVVCHTVHFFLAFDVCFVWGPRTLFSVYSWFCMPELLLAVLRDRMRCWASNLSQSRQGKHPTHCTVSLAHTFIFSSLVISYVRSFSQFAWNPI